MIRTFSDLELQIVLDDLYKVRNSIVEKHVGIIDNAIDAIKYLYDIKKKVHNICQESN